MQCNLTLLWLLVVVLQEMLLDVLVYSEGPRVRDRISHGEVRVRHVISQRSVCMSCDLSAESVYVM